MPNPPPLALVLLPAYVTLVCCCSLVPVWFSRDKTGEFKLWLDFLYDTVRFFKNRKLLKIANKPLA